MLTILFLVVQSRFVGLFLENMLPKYTQSHVVGETKADGE